MSSELYMARIEQILENVSAVACRKTITKGELECVKEATVSILVRHYGFNKDEAESEVAAASGEEP